MMILTNRHITVFRYYLPSGFPSGSAIGTKNFVFLKWFSLCHNFQTTHSLLVAFDFFQFVQAPLVFQLVQESSVFTNFLPSFLIYFFKNEFLLQGAMNAITCLQITYSLIK